MNAPAEIGRNCSARHIPASPQKRNQKAPLPAVPQPRLSGIGREIRQLLQDRGGRGSRTVIEECLERCRPRCGRRGEPFSVRFPQLRNRRLSIFQASDLGCRTQLRIRSPATAGHRAAARQVESENPRGGAAVTVARPLDICRGAGPEWFGCLGHQEVSKALTSKIGYWPSHDFSSLTNDCSTPPALMTIN